MATVFGAQKVESLVHCYKDLRYKIPHQTTIKIVSVKCKNYITINGDALQRTSALQVSLVFA